ncbi:MAG: hypothetical protein NDI82_05095 [Anaeromyxobacteraceae bacterium]|nr:hypothetical protein [Anaeromyxobacteraceae bacterium]
MTHQDAVALWFGTSLLAGIVAHVGVAAWHRRSYARLRRDYADAVADAQESGSAESLVRAEELHRQFMRVVPPRWFAGLGAHFRAAFSISGLVAVGLMIVAGRLPPVFAGLALLFALGLRRILLGAALLLAVFVASSLLSPPRSSDRVPAAGVASASTPARAPARSR